MKKMNIKNTINFVKLRSEGINALNIHDDEIIQVVSKDGIKCIVDQEFLFGLFAKIESLEFKSGELVKTTPYNALNMERQFDKKLKSFSKLTEDDDFLLNVSGCSLSLPTIEDRVSALEKQVKKINNKLEKKNE